MDANKPVLPALPGAPPTQVAAPKPLAGRAADPAAARGAAEDFEAFFLSQAMESMFAGINSNPITGAGSSETVYRSLLLQEYAKVAAKSGGVGIADAVQREILRLQEIEK